jgi:aminoglycoside 6'-N-acetyltransferase
VSPRYLIRPVGEADLVLIAGWRARPHVVRWWGEPSVEPEREKLTEPRIALWLAELDGRPFAFIQDYDVHGWTPHHFDHLPPGARGMDMFIGEADLLGLGHGTELVRRHVERLFARGAPAIGIDPHPDNLAARRAYEKAGFVLTGGPLNTQWGYSVLMERRAPGV